MPEKTEIEADIAAEKAYAAAALTVKPADAATPEPAAPAPAASAVQAAPEVEFPSKAKRERKTKVEALVTAAPPVEENKAPVPFARKAAKPAKAKPKLAVKPKAAIKAKAPPKPLLAKPVLAKPVTVKPALAVKAAAKPAINKKSVFQQIKDKTMDTTEFTTKLKGAVTEAQIKAKEAFDKGAATFGEYNEFTKGNLEAVAASGKILAAGVQSLGKTFVDDGKSAFETLTAEVKELAAVKSPADFFKLQAEFLRRNFDIAVANTSKNSEAVLKLANEVAAPISGRVNLAVEKIKKAA